MARLAAETEATQQARAVKYTNESDPLMYDALEFYSTQFPDDQKFSMWRETKNKIRQELPKPDMTL